MADRASVVTTAILQIITDALRRWNAGEPVALADVRAEVATMLRDEFHDTARTARDETRIDD